MVNFCKDEPKFTAKGDVDLEMQELKDFSSPPPSFLARRLKSLAASQASEINVEGAASSPLSSSFQFPPPPPIPSSPFLPSHSLPFLPSPSFPLGPMTAAEYLRCNKHFQPEANTQVEG